VKGVYDGEKVRKGQLRSKRVKDHIGTPRRINRRRFLWGEFLRSRGGSEIKGIQGKGNFFEGWQGVGQY